jgi:hypothetical protein
MCKSLLPLLLLLPRRPLDALLLLLLLLPLLLLLLTGPSRWNIEMSPLLQADRQTDRQTGRQAVFHVCGTDSVRIPATVCVQMNSGF